MKTGIKKFDDVLKKPRDEALALLSQLIKYDEKYITNESKIKEEFSLNILKLYVEQLTKMITMEKFKENVANDYTIKGGQVQAYYLGKELKKMKEDSNKWQPNDSDKEQLK